MRTAEHQAHEQAELLHIQQALVAANGIHLCSLLRFKLTTLLSSM